MLSLLTYPAIEIKPDYQVYPQSVLAVPTRIAIGCVTGNGLHTRLNPERARLGIVELYKSTEGKVSDDAEPIVETTFTFSNDQVSEHDWQSLDKSFKLLLDMNRFFRLKGKVGLL